MPPAKKIVSRFEAGQLADYWCPGCHAQEKGLPHGVKCPKHGTSDEEESAA